MDPTASRLNSPHRGPAASSQTPEESKRIAEERKVEEEGSDTELDTEINVPFETLFTDEERQFHRYQ